MTSFLPNICRFIDGIEGASFSTSKICEIHIRLTPGLTGIVLNIIVIVVLWRKHLAANLCTYRVSITIAALQGAFYSAIMALLGGVVSGKQNYDFQKCHRSGAYVQGRSIHQRTVRADDSITVCEYTWQEVLLISIFSHSVLRWRHRVSLHLSGVHCLDYCVSCLHSAVLSAV